MDQQNMLIRQLVKDHGPRPFWKRRGVLLSAWMVCHLSFFSSAIMFGSKLNLNSSVMFLALISLACLGSWWAFTRWLSADESVRSHSWAFLACVLGVITMAFLYENFIGHSIAHLQGFGFTSAEANCLFHTVLIAIVPIAFSLALAKLFFIARPIWAMVFLGLHLTLMSITWTEMSCPSREFWHLMLGHQAAVFAVCGILSLGHRLRRQTGA